ncbi:hypothetical protein BDW68DRAFT_196298 [Aspergillus falconensis]
MELLFGEIESIIREGVDLLERRYGVSKQSSNKITRSSSSGPLSALPHVSSRTSPSIPVLFCWSLRNKKRVEAILLSFDRNSRLKRKVELCCLTSQLGISPDHLRHRRTGESSKQLGFDKDASLRLAQHSAETGKLTSLELSSAWDRHLRDRRCRTSRLVYRFGPQSYNQENHRYKALLPADDNSRSSLDPRIKDRIESLARLLHQPKEQLFRIPPVSDQDSIAFIFELESPLGAPVSLQRIRFLSKFVPSLGDKFQLALGLSQCMAQIHMVQWGCTIWLTTTFRSDNILLLPHHISYGSEQRHHIDYSESCVLGFEDRTMGAAIKLEKSMFAYAANGAAVQTQLIKHAQRRLDPRVGRRYKEVVLKCLTGDFGVEEDTREDMKLQQEFRHPVLDVIELAANSV